MFRAYRHELDPHQLLMRRRSVFLVFLFALSSLWMFIPQPVSAQDATPTSEPPAPVPAGTELPVVATPALIGISAPGNGASLSGVVVISGTTLSAWDLSFSYADDPTNTWFPLAQSSDPISAGTLATWDTATITDGFYVLRLRGSAADAAQDFKVNVRVRNYSLVETATSALTLTATPIFTLAPSSVAEATSTSTFTPAPSPTMPAPLPPNPATLDPQKVVVNFGEGALSVIALFILFGLLLSLSRKPRV
jgi:hypothetical protein